MPSRTIRHRIARAIAQAQVLERRIALDADVQSIDGTGNNLLQPEWGAADTALLRLVPAAYADGISSPAGADRPSARVISNAVATHPEEEVPNASDLAAFVYVWGQFIDHDLDLTIDASPVEPFDVAVPAGDEFFDPSGTGTQTIGLNRSAFAEDTGVTTPREQLNEVTAYLDGSMIYGSDDERAAALRESSGGRLRTDSEGLLPLNTEGLPNDNDAGVFPGDQLFLAGDIRANENIELTALHTLFVREHNRLADEIAASDPALTDEQIYQEARRLVIGEIQNITYNEFLPALLGPDALPDYSGYDAGVDAGVSNAFSTAAFRVGHSMLADDVEFIGNDGEEVAEELPLSEAFFNPAAVQEHGIDPILKYLASSNAEEIDNLVVDGVRNFLFGAPGSGGFDLAALNIQRGRDHGLPSYNDTREALGLSRVTSFDQISSDPEVAAKLASVYGSVDDVDLWVGGLAEDHVEGSNVGETFQRLIVDQFTRTRDGDRFWFENDVLSPDELALVSGTTLADVIRANTELTNLQDNVFVFNAEITGQVVNGQGEGASGVGGVTVELVDEEGEVAATATTEAGGSYRFSGVQLGSYVVRPVVPAGLQLVDESEVIITITGDEDFANVDFVLQSQATPQQQPGTEASDQSAGATGVFSTVPITAADSSTAAGTAANSG